MKTQITLTKTVLLKQNSDYACDDSFLTKTLRREMMSKLAVSILLCVLVVGIGSYIFIGNNSVKQKVVDGHTTIKDKVRSWDYVSN
jgi:hypothetical protein